MPDALYDHDEFTFQSPEITLDTTLNDLYAIENDRIQTIALVYAVPSAKIELAPDLPLSKLYSYQSPLSAPDEDPRVTSRLHLQVVPQMYSFIAGNTEVYFFELDSVEKASGSNSRLAREDVLDVYGAITKKQRPRSHIVRSPTEIRSSLGVDCKVAICNPIDCFLDLPLLVDPDRHYELQSKRSLALSNVPTPPTQIIDTILLPEQVGNEALLDDEVARMLAAIQRRAPPFVVKMQQSLGSQGTFIVRNEKEQLRTISSLQIELKRLLLQLDSSNAHFHSCSLCVQDMVEGDALAISLFVTPTGRAIFLACCDQILDEQKQWIGGYITYSDQEKYSESYATILSCVGELAHSKGYHGPMGVDVMTTPEGVHLVIDPNPRVTGTASLGLLKKFFHAERGFRDAALFFPVFLGCTRETFGKLFRKEIRDGKIVITAWSHDWARGVGSVTIIIAGETRERIRKVKEKVDVHLVEP